MTRPDRRRQILFSTYGHAGADLLGYKPYQEKRYLDAFDAWASTFHDVWAENSDQDRDPNHRIGIASAAAPVNWDTGQRRS